MVVQPMKLRLVSKEFVDTILDRVKVLKVQVEYKNRFLPRVILKFGDHLMCVLHIHGDDIHFGPFR